MPQSDGLKQAIALFEILLTVKQLSNADTASKVTELAKASLLGFVLVQVRKTVLNRHYSSLSMVGDLEKVIAEALQLLLRQPARVGRGAPEFVNIRHKVIDPVYSADPSAHLEDLNTLPAKNASEDPFDTILTEGGYEAALFEDGVSDGCVSATVSGLPNPLESFPAFSVIGAPESFSEIL